MISNPILLLILFAGSALLSAASLAPFVIPRLTRLWRQATPLGRFAFVVAALASTLYGGAKTNDVDSTGSSGTNRLMAVMRRLLPPAVLQPAVTEEDIARGWQVLGPYTNVAFSYVMPTNATLATNWWLRGAFEDVAPVSGLWAFSWGKVRFALNDSSNEIAAVGAPMSAVPLQSRLWSAAETNGTRVITWENFVLGRSNALVSAQIELLPNGDHVIRSNEVETVWRRIDSTDVDGDGYLNDDDPNPWEWTDGVESYYGPQDGLPPYCNEDAYCSITVEIDASQGQTVNFSGDSPSNYPDPCFYAKPGVPHEVKILIGKTYRVTCAAPIRVTGTSNEEILVTDVTANGFTVVWPVTITEMPRLFAAPSPGLLGGSRGNSGFTMNVIPSWLGGVFEWGTNACCQIVDNGDWWSFSCEDGCMCNGCLIGGGYTYEGYTLSFSGVRCGCTYRSDPTTRWGIVAPDLLFKDGALRPLSISFYHGDPDDPEEGTMTLQVNDDGKLRIWEDEGKTSAASTFSWDVSSFNGHAFYLEGIGASDSIGDITFDLTWTRPGGSSVTYTAATTCAEVKQIEVTSSLPDGSSNPPPFDGNMSWDFDVTHSPHPDKHFAVLFRDAVNDDFSVRDFTVTMTLVVQPTNAPVGRATWFPLNPTPGSGQLVSAGNRVGELRNPKVGGVYHFGACFDGSPTNECNIVLPLAGASVEDVLREDLVRADEFATFVRSRLDEKQINTIEFGLYFFWDAGRGDYLGRPDNLDFPTVWSYNQVTTSGRQFGKGAVATLFGLPIRISKLSNLLAAYTCDRLGVYQELQNLSQWIGTRNDDSSLISWNCGTALAHGSNYVHSVSNMVRQCWGASDAKAAKLWPNTSVLDNHAASVYYGDVERFFYSPGMLYFIQQISTGNNQ